jgi:hypothetical protein
MVALQVRQCQARTSWPLPGLGQCATITFGYRSACPLGHRSGGISVDAVGIRPELHPELLEHVFAYLGIPISPRHAGQGVSAAGGQRSYLSIAVAPLALST